MIIGRIRGSNFTYMAPPDMENCQDLHVNVSIDSQGLRIITSAWYPTAEEVELMRQGQPIHLSIYGNSHPPVLLTVPRD